MRIWIEQRRECIFLFVCRIGTMERISARGRDKAREKYREKEKKKFFGGRGRIRSVKRDPCARMLHHLTNLDKLLDTIILNLANRRLLHTQQSILIGRLVLEHVWE